MSTSRVWAIARLQLLLSSKDLSVVILLLIMPLILITFSANGIFPLIDKTAAAVAPVSSDFTVPAFTVMFAFFQTGYLGYAFVHEHGWRTWPRLRISSATAPEIIVGKILPYAVLIILQFTIMLTAGRVLFEMHLTGSVVALELMVLATVAVVCAFGVAFVAVFKKGQQITAAANLGAILLAALGGAIVPHEALPGWATPLSPVTPHYWAMKGFRTVISDGGSVGDILPSLAVLAGMSVVLGVVAVTRLRLDEPRLAAV